MIPSTIKHIFFDLGDTLVEAKNTLSPRAFVQQKLNYDLPKPELRHMLMTSTIESFEDLVALLEKKFTITLNNNQRVKLYDYYHTQMYLPELRPHALEIVKDLSNRYSVNAISNIWAPYWGGIKVCCSELVKEFCYTILSFEIAIAKPDLSIYSHAIEKVKTQAHKCLMIGDDLENDIIPANALGMYTIWLLSKPDKQYKDMIRVLNNRSLAPDRVITNLKELEELL